MRIEMIGIDHTRAPLDVRQIFSFTKKAMSEALGWLNEQEYLSGAVLLSTCNRMELWLSLKEAKAPGAYELLCQCRKLESEEYRSYFRCRDGADAVHHLFRLAGGLESKIVGEDQVLAQVKEAAAFSREHGCMDQALEVLFRMAVTAGKKIKTQAPIRRADYSAAHQALEVLKAQGICIKNRRCLVIGNGEMGQLAACALMEEGAKVTMTLRQYRSGGGRVPAGCRCINYKDRYGCFSESSLVVSATASPNFTITWESVAALGEPEEEKILIDLAVPRDMEPSVGELPGIRLYDIDSFHLKAQPKEMRRQIQAAEAIAEEMEGEFLSWAACRELIPKVQRISHLAAQDAVWRTGKAVKELGLSKTEQANLEQTMENATTKVIGKLMFELRDSLNVDTFRECLEALEQVYPAS